MPAAEPLLDRGPEELLFRRPGRAVSASEFLRDVRAAAAGLGAGRHTVNLCRDRYLFAVAFAAALVAGRTSLLNVTPEEAARRYDDLSVLDDAAVEQAMAGPGGGGADGPPLVAAGHVAAIVFTSGSTGEPVPHAKGWGGLVARSRATPFCAGVGGGGGTMLGTVPPQHMYGFETTVLLPLHAPVASWCGPAFFPADVAAALLECEGPRRLVTTPLQLRTLLQAGLGGPDAVISATAPLDPALAAQAEAAWGAPVHEIFGATECGSIASRRTTAGGTWTPYPGVRLELGAAATVHAPGADPVALADLLEPDGAGFRLLGRRADVVKLGGRRASLPGLNRLLTALPGVDDGAFVAPGEDGSSRLVAIVVAPGRTGPAILADLRRVMDPVFVPRRVIRVEALPRNDLGKLPRQALLRLVEAADA